MQTHSIRIKEPKTPEEFHSYYTLRYETLRKPWQQPLGSERDDADATSIHIMASNENNVVLGVCRLHYNSSKEAQVRFMGVADYAQKLGIGKALMHTAEKMATDKGAKKMVLDARENAVDFYKKCGYKVVKKSYLLWGIIQHYVMEKTL